MNAGVFGATIIQGFGSTATAAFQTYLNGAAQGSRPMEIIHSGGNFCTNTTAYGGICAMIADTSDATATAMMITPGIAAATEFTIPQDHTVAVRVSVVARSAAGGDHAAWFFDALIEDTGGVLTLVSPGAAIVPTHTRS